MSRATKMALLDFERRCLWHNMVKSNKFMFQPVLIAYPLMSRSVHLMVKHTGVCVKWRVQHASKWLNKWGVSKVSDPNLLDDEVFCKGVLLHVSSSHTDLTVVHTGSCRFIGKFWKCSQQSHKAQQWGHSTITKRVKLLFDPLMF